MILPSYFLQNFEVSLQAGGQVVKIKALNCVANLGFLMCVYLPVIIIFVCASGHIRVRTWWPWGCPPALCGGVVTWRAEMDGLIDPIYERHPPIGHTSMGPIRDVPIGYQSDWLGPLLKVPAQARFWGRRPRLPPRTSSPPSPVALGAAPDHPHHHISTRSSVKPH